MSKNTSKIVAFVAVVVLAGLIVAVGCSNSSNPSNSYSNNPPPSSPPPPAPPPQSQHRFAVSIMNFAFSPASLTVAAGDTVVWTNNDSIDHTVTSDTGSELGSPQLGSGSTYMHVFSTAGSYTYHCTNHPYMHGSATVQ